MDLRSLGMRLVMSVVLPYRSGTCQLGRSVTAPADSGYWCENKQSARTQQPEAADLVGLRMESFGGVTSESRLKILPGPQRKFYRQPSCSAEVSHTPAIFSQHGMHVLPPSRV